MLPRYAPRRDPGEAAIVKALRHCGVLVWQLSAKGVPDLLVGHAGKWSLLEVKAPLGDKGGKSANGQRLKPEQQKFFHDAELGSLPAFVVRSPAEALEVLGLRRPGREEREALFRRIDAGIETSRKRVDGFEAARRDASEAVDAIEREMAVKLNQTHWKSGEKK